MLGYNMIEAQIYYPRYIYMVEARVHYKLLVEHSSVSGTNYCPDYYLRYIYMVEGS